MENFLIPFFRLSIRAIEIFKWMIFARILISWIQHDRHAKWAIILQDFTEPFLKLFRDIIPRIGMIDFSPIVAFIVLEFIQSGLARWIIALY